MQQTPLEQDYRLTQVRGRSATAINPRNGIIVEVRWYGRRYRRFTYAIAQAGDLKGCIIVTGPKFRIKHGSRLFPVNISGGWGEGLVLWPPFRRPNLAEHLAAKGVSSAYADHWQVSFAADALTPS